jgi:hypothetical protein
VCLAFLRPGRIIRVKEGQVGVVPPADPDPGSSHQQHTVVLPASSVGDSTASADAAHASAAPPDCICIVCWCVSAATWLSLLGLHTTTVQVT